MVSQPGWTGLRTSLRAGTFREVFVKTVQINVKGIVQGVGFRPFVYQLAQKNHLKGMVWNTSRGVEIIVTGENNPIDTFLAELRSNPPPLARIDHLESKSIPIQFFSVFEIAESKADAASFVPVSPDICICEDCRRELFDSANRRFRYPFINCTNCGPRLTILQDVPYDRALTTMAGFPMCEECLSEYSNPGDRRYHAQPIACPNCGPRVTFTSLNMPAQHGENAISHARKYLKQGKIIAIKGLGGYHIACDAANESAVTALIERKKRSEKPLALMAFDEKSIRKYCHVGSIDSALLNSLPHPIVLLEKRGENLLPDMLSIRQNTLGFMLPYTPLHLLMLEPEEGFPDVLVMTSGNLSEEPIAYEDADAMQRLTPLVDGFISHNRAIQTRVDDSVVRLVNNKTYFIRRSRGYAPDPIRLPFEVPDILACGAELKNTFCLSKSNYAFMSHHIGDLENYETLKAYETGIDHYQKLFRVNPEIIAADLHPDYLSTKYAQDLAAKMNLPLLQVQHHHAHLAACLADNGWKSDDPVIGCILDGTGYGSDGHIWGGEFLLGSYKQYSRQLHLREVPLPGGDSSIKQPAKIGISYLHDAGIELDSDLPPLRGYSKNDIGSILQQISTRINTPMTSSMGRLFDAVASIIGIRQKISYEAQAAIELEYYCDLTETGSYDFEIDDGIIDTRKVIRSIVSDLTSGIHLSRISGKFHNTIARICLDACKAIGKSQGIKHVALSGGVWQNKTLLEKTLPLLEHNGFSVLIHNQVPPNDGGVSLGQLVIAAKFQE